MGDRGNVVVGSPDRRVYLYAHGLGRELPRILQDALNRELRWDDEQYLTRIIFCEMLRNGYHDPEAALDSETGFGISAYLGDGSHPLLEVDPGEQTVTVSGRAWTFAEYCVLDLEQTPGLL